MTVLQGHIGCQDLWVRLKIVHFKLAQRKHHLVLLLLEIMNVLDCSHDQDQLVFVVLVKLVNCISPRNALLHHYVSKMYKSLIWSLFPHNTVEPLYMDTPEMRTSPLIRTLSVVPTT